MYKYPKINYIGNKEKLAKWICDSFPAEATTIFDAFSGGCSIAYEAKKRGFGVITNDILKINYHISSALIKNKNVKLTQRDIELIFSGKPIEGFMYKNYSNIYFYQDECMQLDQYRHNIEMLECEYKKSLAIILIRRAMIRKMPYSRFTIPWDTVKQLRDEEYSYAKYKRRRAYHNQSFKEHFIENLQHYHDSIFDNNKQNSTYNGDIFETIDNVDADIIYLDPPYTGTMNNYFGFYGLLDNYIDGRINKQFENNFIDKQQSIGQFEKLFFKAQKFKYLILSYNSHSYPDQMELERILLKYFRNVQILEKNHTYKITGKEMKRQHKEYLFLADNN